MRVGTGFCQQKAVEGLGYFCKGKLTELSTRTWVTIDWPKLLLGQSQKARCRMFPWAMGTRRHQTTPGKDRP